ncbi:MAG TPA: Fe-S cluster assembly protein SufD [Pinirhizobacter sp.]|uniref:Fe-S cluster assembly protein SufD n=1 Tax=Pinirhizobacter sp. TaxID=2950432 RepID=UPI002CF7E162|nr:Fe-S cluster assembly protein SufD [Pinirhizobacter sp.]HMH69098.1 Fe-S cluster assembly protein SufD [Pinirhizobacter sp.]
MSEAIALRTPLVESQVQAAAARQPGDEPAWLAQARAENLAAFAAGGLPDTRIEAWKYTALRALGQRRIGPVDVDAAIHATVDGTLFALPGVDGPRLVFVDGVFRADLSTAHAVAGLEVMPLSRALREQPESLRFALSRHYRERADAFAQLNAALGFDGVVVRVASGAKLSSSLHMVFAGGSQAEAGSHLRVIVDVGAGAEVNVVEHHVAVGEASNLATLVTDIAVHDDARLGWLIVQDAGIAATLVRRTRAQLGARASATIHALELGGALVRHDVACDLAGAGARLETRGVFVIGQRQHVDTQLSVRHGGRDTTSDALWRGVADGRARGVFRGAIVVAEGADGSDAALSNKNLLLSANAEIDTKPELEIYADEVKAAHGATIGQLDERALFYLRSRGIGLAQARSLLTLAFCRVALADIGDERLREHLGDLLAQRLPRMADVA